MRDTTSTAKPTEAIQGLTLTLPAVVAASLQELVHTVGLHALSALLQAEQAALCGPRYQHDPKRTATRHGTTQGELVLGGRRVRVPKPRVRSVTGHELPLPTWEQFSNEDPLDQRATEQMLVGVSTRKYARSLEPVPQELDAFGTSKSAVSRRFVKQTTAQVHEFLLRRLSAYQRVAKATGRLHAEQRAAALEATVRLLPRVGRLLVRKPVKGRCQEVELWMPPGQQSIELEGTPRQVRMRARETVVIDACEPSGGSK